MTGFRVECLPYGSLAGFAWPRHAPNSSHIRHEAQTSSARRASNPGLFEPGLVLPPPSPTRYHYFISIQTAERRNFCFSGNALTVSIALLWAYFSPRTHMTPSDESSRPRLSCINACKFSAVLILLVFYCHIVVITFGMYVPSTHFNLCSIIVKGCLGLSAYLITLNWAYIGNIRNCLVCYAFVWWRGLLVINFSTYKSSAIFQKC